jgi:hypothetical protein
LRGDVVLCICKAKHQARHWYNIYLERHHKAVTYFESNVSLEKKKEWQPRYKDVVDSLNELLRIIGEYTEDEVLNGFKEG